MGVDPHRLEHRRRLQRLRRARAARVGGDAEPVERYEARNVLAIKYVCHEALGGGAPRSLRADNLGKTLGARLLQLHVEVPDAVAAGARRRERAPLP